MRHATVDVVGEDLLRGVDIALQRAVQQCLVLLDRGAAAILQRVAEVFVEDDGVGLHQLARAATRNQRLVKFAVVALAQLRVVALGLDRAFGSCQLVMGLTALEPGNVWNSFPPHTHWRRTEIYFYFDLGDKVLSHFLGEPQESRHLFLHNEDVALSPNWSMHFGVGTGNYKFIWGMAGENQVFDDMDAVKPVDLR